MRFVHFYTRDLWRRWLIFAGYLLLLPVPVFLVGGYLERLPLVGLSLLLAGLLGFDGFRDWLHQQFTPYFICRTCLRMGLPPRIPLIQWHACPNCPFRGFFSLLGPCPRCGWAGATEMIQCPQCASSIQLKPYRRTR